MAANVLAASASGDLLTAGVGDGGIDELAEAVDLSIVQWGLVEIHVGGETLRRKKVIFLHINPESCPIMVRSRSNEYTAHVKKMLAPEDTAGFFPTVEILSTEQMTLEYILERVEPYMKEISADYSVSYLCKQHELRVAEIKRQKIEALHGGTAADGTEHGRRVGWRTKPAEFFKAGRDALKAVSEQFGPWNWMFWRPSTEEGECVELITGGCDSLEEMRTYLSEHLGEPMFGLIRMGFGIGRLRRTKHIFVHAVGPEASAVRRGKISAEISRMKQWVEGSTNVSVHIEVTDETAMTDEIVVARVRKAARIDDEEVPGDEGLKDTLTVEGMQQAHMEERTKMQLPGEAEALEEASEVQRQQWMDLPLDELLRLFHYDGAPNWVLFGPGETWSGSNAFVPGYALQSGKLKPGVRFGAAGGVGGFLSAEERRRSAMEEAAAQRALTAGPPTMTFGASAAKGVGDQKLAAMLARQRDKQAKAHAANMTATVEEGTEEEEQEPPEMVEASDQPPTGTMVAEVAMPLSDLPLTTTKDMVDPLPELPTKTAEVSGSHLSTRSSPGQDLMAANMVKVSDAASSGSSETREPTEKSAVGDSTEDHSPEEFYSLAELTNPQIWRCKPDVVERPHEREQFLAPDIFEVVFGMAKDDFAKLPLWKQSALKKQHQLF